MTLDVLDEDIMETENAEHKQDGSIHKAEELEKSSDEHMLTVCGQDGFLLYLSPNRKCEGQGNDDAKSRGFNGNCLFSGTYEH